MSVDPFFLLNSMKWLLMLFYLVWFIRSSSFVFPLAYMIFSLQRIYLIPFPHATSWSPKMLPTVPQLVIHKSHVRPLPPTLL